MDFTNSKPFPGDLSLPSHQATIVTVLRERAALNPEKKAFTFLVDNTREELSITYGALDSAARRYAKNITELGLKRKVVMLCYPSGLDFIMTFFGCLYCGTIPVTVYPPRKNRSLKRIHSIIANCGITAILTTDATSRSMKRNFSSDPLFSGLSMYSTDVWSIDEPEEDQQEKPGFEDIAFLQYTSGSTGDPKGVMISHRNLMYNLRSLQILFRISPDEIAVHWVPQFHDLGLVFGIMETVFSGSLSILISPSSFIADPVFLLETIQRYHATLSGQPDFAFNLCVEKATEAQILNLDLSSLRVLYSGAEPVRKQTLDKFFQLFSRCGLKPEVFTPGYGMAESTLILTVGDVLTPPKYLPLKKAELERNLISLASDGDPENEILYITSNGKPSLDTKVIIVNPETLEILPQCHLGEIWGTGSTIGMGYYNNPQYTNEVFRSTLAGNNEFQWLRTGDQGFIYQDELFITGRLKDLIIIRGRNFYPQDIETVIEDCHQAIRKTCTVAFSYEENGKEKLALAIELRRLLIPPDFEQIFTDIIHALSNEFEILPSRIAFVRTGSIPKTSSGKLMRGEVRKSLLQGKLEIIKERTFEDHEIPDYSFQVGDSQSLESFLIAWVSLHLNKGLTIDPSKTLADYGIDSIVAVLLVEDTQKTFGFEWPLYLFFEDLSIIRLAEEGQKLIEEK